MANHATSSGDAPLTALTREAINEAGKLIEQQFRLVKQELKEEARKAGQAATALGTGAGLATVGGVCGTFMVVHLLQRTTGLPLWCCYGLVGGLIGLAGTQILTAGAVRAADVQVVPPQTMETIKDNVGAVREALVSAVS